MTSSYRCPDKNRPLHNLRRWCYWNIQHRIGQYLRLVGSYERLRVDYINLYDTHSELIVGLKECGIGVKIVDGRVVLKEEDREILNRFYGKD